MKGSFPLMAAAALAGSGCGSPPRRPPPAPVPVAVQVLPPGPPLPPVAALPAAPEPVYRNPKIGLVYLRAHLDAQGRLLGPQVMYQVVDPGGWNLEAIDQGRAYIPAVNIDVPAGAGSPYVVPAREVPPLPPNAPLLDAEVAAHATLTGLMRPEDRGRAEAMARAAGGRTAVFDDQAGWVLLPAKCAP